MTSPIENEFDRILRQMRKTDASTPPSREEVERSARDIENRDNEQNIKLKREMFEWTQCAVSGWLIFIVLFMFAALYSPGRIGGEVLITLLATTTVNIIGLPLVITRSLFKD